MRRYLLIPLTAALLALTPAVAGALTLAPRGFIGISPQGANDGSDYELMQLAGVESVRLPMSWANVEPEASAVDTPNWSGFDNQVAFAAQHGITVFPFLWGTPDWVSPYPGAEPVESGWQRQAWTDFLRAVVERYGPDGEFWR